MFSYTSKACRWLHGNYRHCLRGAVRSPAGCLAYIQLTMKYLWVCHDKDAHSVHPQVWRPAGNKQWRRFILFFHGLRSNPQDGWGWKRLCRSSGPTQKASQNQTQTMYRSGVYAEVKSSPVVLWAALHACLQHRGRFGRFHLWKWSWGLSLVWPVWYFQSGCTEHSCSHMLQGLAGS